MFSEAVLLAVVYAVVAGSSCFSVFCKNPKIIFIKTNVV